MKKVSIQGMIGSFHYIVATNLYGKELELFERNTFDEVFEDVKNNSAEVGIIAIENSIAGSILKNYDLLRNYDHNIIGEHYLRIEHNLMALDDQNLEDITEVRSHPMAILQCQEFLKTLNVKVVEVPDTAGAAKEIKEKNLKGVAAIASKAAAEVYGMKIIKENIETDKQNYTRFLVISKENIKVENADKTSIAVELPDKSGSLFKFLQVFDSFDVSMTKIESRPIIGRPWDYRFYIDYEMDIYSDKGKVLLDFLKKNSVEIQVLGSYKKGLREY